MRPTDRLFDEMPEDFEGDLTLFQLVSSLAQQLEDRQQRREHDIQDLRGIEITIAGADDTPMIALKVMQTEILRQKEDINLLASTINAMEQRAQVLYAYSKVHRDKLDQQDGEIQKLLAENKNLNERLTALEKRR